MSVCIVDDAGRIVREARVASEPEALLQVLANNTYRFKRVGHANGRIVANVERLFLDQLNIVAQEDMRIEIDENGNDVLEGQKRKSAKAKPKGKGRNSKAYRQAKQQDKRRRFRVIRKLRRMAEVAFEMATKERNLEAMMFIADRMDGKPTATQFIAVQRQSTDLSLDLTYEEARDRLLEMGIDVERQPMLAGMKRSGRFSCRARGSQRHV